jgi:inner membrane protein
MEPMTQALLGAATGELVAGRRLGRRALFWGALIGMSPDLDVVLAPLRDGYGEWLYHRGTTHSLWFGFVVGPPIAAFLWRWQDPKGSTPYSAWAALAITALVTHPLLDGFTPYGTQFFAPFSRERFAWNGVAIVDPFYSALLALGVWLAASKTRPDRERRTALSFFLVLSMLYLGVGVGVNQWVEQDLRSTLARDGFETARVTAYPTLLQPWLRHFVAHGRNGNLEGERVRIGWHSAMQPGCPSWRTRLPPRSDPRGRAMLASRGGGILDWFADGELGLEARRTLRGSTLRIDDLRYTWGSASGIGMWGIEAKFDDSGRMLGEPRRFGRADPSARDLDSFLAAVLGDLPGPEDGWTRPLSCPNGRAR